MNATTLKQTEAAVDGYDAPDGLSTEAQSFVDAAWQRVEAYIAWRWAERDVTWLAEGPGDWVPPLKPSTIATVEEWRGATWVETTLDPSPLGGFILKGCGPYRFTGTAGDDGDVPSIVWEAVSRLAEYMAKPAGKGASSETVTAGSVSISTTRSPSWMAKAIDNSGAGDLLRSYRR